MDLSVLARPLVEEVFGQVEVTMVTLDLFVLVHLASGQFGNVIHVLIQLAFDLLVDRLQV
jgi:hypothetical protein